MALVFKDESQRLKDEYDELFRRNNELYRMLLDVADWVWYMFKKDLVVTMIRRTQEEQDRIYKGKRNSKGVLYETKPWKSPHQFWHAADLRSRVFTKDEIKQIEDYINNRYKTLNY